MHIFGFPVGSAVGGGGVSVGAGGRVFVGTRVAVGGGGVSVVGGGVSDAGRVALGRTVAVAASACSVAGAEGAAVGSWFV